MIPLSDHKSGYRQTVFEKAGVFVNAALGMEAQSVEVRTRVLGIFEENFPGEILPLLAQRIMKPSLWRAWW